MSFTNQWWSGFSLHDADWCEAQLAKAGKVSFVHLKIDRPIRVLPGQVVEYCLVEIAMSEDGVTQCIDNFRRCEFITGPAKEDAGRFIYGGTVKIGSGQ